MNTAITKPPSSVKTKVATIVTSDTFKLVSRRVLVVLASIVWAVLGVFVIYSAITRFYTPANVGVLYMSSGIFFSAAPQLIASWLNRTMRPVIHFYQFLAVAALPLIAMPFAAPTITLVGVTWLGVLWMTRTPKIWGHRG